MSPRTSELILCITGLKNRFPSFATGSGRTGDVVFNGDGYETIKQLVELRSFFTEGGLLTLGEIRLASFVGCLLDLFCILETDETRSSMIHFLGSNRPCDMNKSSFDFKWRSLGGMNVKLSALLSSVSGSSCSS